MTSDRQVRGQKPVWVGKPWIAPSATIRTISIIVVVVIILVLEAKFGGFSYDFIGVPFWAWTIIVFAVIWILSLIDLLILRFSNTYVLWQDGLEVRHGILALHSFVVTPAGFGDLLVYQSVGGRIFSFGDITVNSQAERQTKLLLVRDPFKVADTMRDIMGKPIVRVDGQT